MISLLVHFIVWQSAQKSSKVSILYLFLDTKVPQIRLVGKPPLRSTYSVGSFSWTSDEFATFSCAVDVAEYAVPCGSGLRGNWMTSELDDGTHSFYLFAEDANGNQADPITYQWTIGKNVIERVLTSRNNQERVGWGTVVWGGASL